MFVHSLLPNNGLPKEWTTTPCTRPTLHLAPTNGKGDYTLEIYAQLRPSGLIPEHFRAVLGDPSLQRATRFCTGELFIPFLRNQLAAKLEVPNSNNQSYYQHTIITLADSNNQSYYQHTIITLADSNNQSY
jgi:hypothetical protein